MRSETTHTAQSEINLILKTIVIFLAYNICQKLWRICDFHFQSSVNMINRELIVSEWSENVVPHHSVPKNLFPHQVDAMALIKDRQHVFLG